MSKHTNYILTPLSADAETPPYSLQGVSRVGIKVECPTGDTVGTFKVQTRCSPDAEWDDHPTFSAAKASGNSLAARFDWSANCGWQIRVAWVVSSGTTPAAGATVYISLY